MSRLLVTVERDDAALLKKELESGGWEIVHLPLEQYHYSENPEQTETVREEIGRYRFVLYGGLRNARYFYQWLEEQNRVDEAREMIHLALGREEAAWLEERSIPVIVPVDGGRSIDLIEFLLRISVSGEVLYPTVEGHSEEVPGLLEELGMVCTELAVCRSMPFKRDRLRQLRETLSGKIPDTILFHSRGSVIRTRSAFPELDLASCRLVAASEGVAWKMRQEGLQPDLTAGGTWKSVTTLLSPES